MADMTPWEEEPLCPTDVPKVPEGDGTTVAIDHTDDEKLPHTGMDEDCNTIGPHDIP